GAVADLEEVELAAGAARGEPAAQRDGLPREAPHPLHRGDRHGSRIAEPGAGRRVRRALAAPAARRYTRPRMRVGRIGRGMAAGVLALACLAGGCAASGHGARTEDDDLPEFSAARLGEPGSLADDALSPAEREAARRSW